MRHLLFLLAFLAFTGAQAQTQTDVISKKTKKKTHSAKVTSRPPEKYPSTNGKMKARSLGRYETPDTVTKADKDAEHVNSNYNESMPPLSPNSGSSSPNGK